MSTGSAGPFFGAARGAPHDELDISVCLPNCKMVDHAGIRQYYIEEYPRIDTKNYTHDILDVITIR